MRPFSADGAFTPSVPFGGGELRRLTVRGAGATLAAGVMTLSTQIIATMILARLLTPTDFGLVTMVTTFSLLVANFGFNGLTEAIVQCDEIDHALASTLFWINAACGILLTIGFAEAGSLLARFYHDPLVQRITVFISLTIFATSISTVHLALLKRAMHFSWVSANDICRPRRFCGFVHPAGLDGVGILGVGRGSRCAASEHECRRLHLVQMDTRLSAESCRNRFDVAIRAQHLWEFRRELPVA